MIIGSILNSSGNEDFVCLECDSNIANQLRENRDMNNLKFQIGVTALSKRPLIQRGWDTMVSDELLPGYNRVNTVSFDELIQKYNIAFDTLVLDCEGAFYYILMDMPDVSHKQYIDKVLSDRGFYVDYSQSGGWGPCYNNFFEVWKRS
jgi:FkbM family methyltransferase